MRKVKYCIVVSFALLLFVSAKVAPEFRAHAKYTVAGYIESYKPVAITEMQRTGVPASITLAQAILESGFGNSELAINANNHFGIKCKPDWNGATYMMGGGCYKKYSSVLESYQDHSNHLKTRQWYAFLFNLNTTDYKAWATGLKNAGYAEDPTYAFQLIRIIETYQLSSLDSLYILPR